ncbi:MAG: hypothetical protein EAZ55_05635 [Cytophagales bacterium]|nr:MAG: hypothetical protein EAZ55_05635 [Cytophagales bacterium]
MSFRIYSSSAGSGKTYTLTKEYLKLALKSENPAYFRHILAITFTNDAANEMKERILKALKQFANLDKLTAKDKKNAEILLNTIKIELYDEYKISLDTQQLRQRAEQVFRRIVYNYTDFAVSTIDSFINMVINAFTQELNIPYNYELDIDTKRLLRTTIERVLEKVGMPDKTEFSNVVVSWAKEKVNEGKNWNRIGTELVEFASQELVNERSYNHIEKIRQLSFTDFLQIKHKTESYLKNVQNILRHHAGIALQLIEENNIQLNEFFQGDKGVGVYFKHIEELRRDKIFKPMNNYVAKAVNDDIWYSKSKNYNKNIDTIKVGLLNTIISIEEIKKNHQASYILAEMTLKHIYKLSLIQEIEKELQKVKIENNTIHISDTTKKIAEIISHEPVPFIYEKVGEKYNHILIDEFQDTSVLQWLNLLPLVENNLANGNFNLIVGDAKQAIYRWRGGEMEQLVYLYKNQIEELIKFGRNGLPFLEDRYSLIAQNYQPAQLNTNYRSAKEIIEFNNDFFKTIVEVHQHNYPLLAVIYDDYFQQQIPPNNTQTDGHVEIKFIERTTGNKEQYILDTFAEIDLIIAQCLQDGFQYQDIAILSRNNINARYIAHHLKEQKIPIISRDSLLLTSDEKIVFLVAMMKVINQPDDKLAKSEALYLFYVVIQKQIPDEDTNEAIKQTVHQPISYFFQALHQLGYILEYTQLQQLGVYELAEKLLRTFHILENQPHLAYIFRFMDLILEFKVNSKNNNLADFILFWEDKRQDTSISNDAQNAIEIITIHRSKGLEYPIVICPFLDWEIERKGGTLWIELVQETKDNDLPFLEINDGEQHLSSIMVQNNAELKKSIKVEAEDNKDNENVQKIKNQLDKEEELNFIENLNTLYVAFTRAAQRLYLIAQASEPDKALIASLIARYLAQKGILQEGQLQYTITQGKPQKGNDTKPQNNDFFDVVEFVSTDTHWKFKDQIKPN